MKKINKLFALTVIMALMVTLCACGNEKSGQNSKPDENSKPTVSTPSNDNTTTDNKPDESEPDDNKPDENKPQNRTPSKPVENKIPITAIIGQWKSQVDASEILAEQEITLDKQILINVKTTFGNDNSYCVSVSPLEIEQVLKNALSDEYDDNFINNCVSLLDDALYESGVYKFEGDKLLIMWDGDPDYTEVDYAFKGSKDKLTISFPSDERTYNRI